MKEKLLAVLVAGVVCLVCLFVLGSSLPVAVCFSLLAYFFWHNVRWFGTSPSEPAKENQQIPIDTTTPPAPTDQRTRFWPIIRDVIIVWVLTSLGGFVVGVASSGKASHDTPQSLTALAVSNFLFGTVAFTIAGCLTPLKRWRHLRFVAVGAWFASLINVVFFGVTIPQWIGGAIFMAIIMGLGGAISFVLRREIKPSASA